MWHIIDHVKNVDTRDKVIFILKNFTLRLANNHGIYANLSYLLEKVKDNLMLDGDKNTLVSTTSSNPSICFPYTACIPAMHAGMFKIHSYMLLRFHACLQYGNVALTDQEKADTINIHFSSVLQRKILLVFLLWMTSTLVLLLQIFQYIGKLFITS